MRTENFTLFCHPKYVQRAFQFSNEKTILVPMGMGIQFIKSYVGNRYFKEDRYHACVLNPVKEEWNV